MAWSLARGRSGRRRNNCTTTAVCILKPTKEQPIFLIEHYFLMRRKAEKTYVVQEYNVVFKCRIYANVRIDTDDCYRSHEKKRTGPWQSWKTEDTREKQFRGGRLSNISLPSFGSHSALPSFFVDLTYCLYHFHFFFFFLFHFHVHRIPCIALVWFVFDRYSCFQFVWVTGVWIRSDYCRTTTN